MDFAIKKLRNDAFENLPGKRKLDGFAEAKRGFEQILIASL